MAIKHSAISLFDLNIQSAEDCIKIYRGLSSLHTSLDKTWMLRAAVVFMVSAVDNYFHDKIKYKLGSFKIDRLPKALSRFPIIISDLGKWSTVKRKGNVLRNLVMNYLSFKPLQNPQIIADNLKLIGIENFWDILTKKYHPAINPKKQFEEIVKRRNQIAHEGDRLMHRSSGKELRKIAKIEVNDWCSWIKSFIHRIDILFPT